MRLSRAALIDEDNVERGPQRLEPAGRRARQIGAAFARPASEHEQRFASTRRVRTRDEKRDVDPSSLTRGAIFEDGDRAARRRDRAARTRVQLNGCRWWWLGWAGARHPDQQRCRECLPSPSRLRQFFSFFVTVTVHRSRPWEFAVNFMITALRSMTP